MNARSVAHRAAIAEIFGIAIECDKTTNEYYIAEQGDIGGKGIRSWLVDTFAISNMVNLAGDMKNRIIFEKVPEKPLPLHRNFTANGWARP